MRLRDKPMRRVIASTGALSLIVLLATACADRQCPVPRASEVDLVWAVGAGDALQGGASAETVELWNARYPSGPKVRITQVPPSWSVDEQRRELSEALNLESPEYDVLGLDVIWTGQFVEQGWVLSLEELRPVIQHASLAKPFDSAVWNGDLWAAPYRSNVGLLYYRTDLVERPPQTWDELLRVGQQAAQQAGITPFVGQGGRSEGLVVNFLEYFWAFGGDLQDQDRTARRRALEQAIDFMRTAQRQHFYHPQFNTMDAEGALTEFQAGNAVFMRNWPHAYGAMRNSEVAGKFAVAPLPTFDGKGTTPALGGMNLAVSRFSKNVDSAKAFVCFASTDPQAQSRLGQRAVPPSSKSAYDHELKADPLMAQLPSILQHDARLRLATAQWPALSEVIQIQVYDAYNGQTSPADAAAEIEAALEQSASRPQPSPSTVTRRFT